MKVFLSWSGKVSHDVASALRKWLPYMHHSLRPFISSDDISRGDRWSGALARELKDSECGIICITPFNAHKPWMNFEAGALTNYMGATRVMPLLFQVERSTLEYGPLGQFQTTDSNNSDFYSLVNTLNSSLPKEAQLDSDVLRENFNEWWPKLEKDLKAITLTSPGETRTTYPWLLTFEDLAIHTPVTDCTRIWFVTADIFKFAIRAGMRDELERNLSTIKYRLLIRKPGIDDERIWTGHLEEVKTKHGPNLEYQYYDGPQFEKVAASDYVMVEKGPNGGPSPSVDGSPASVDVYVRIPVADGATEYWFETDERAAVTFFSRFDELWKSKAAATDTTGAPEAAARLAR
jgi:hypothetical protein